MTMHARHGEPAEPSFDKLRMTGDRYSRFDKLRMTGAPRQARDDGKLGMKIISSASLRIPRSSSVPHLCRTPYIPN